MVENNSHLIVTESPDYRTHIQTFSNLSLKHALVSNVFVRSEFCCSIKLFFLLVPQTQMYQDYNAPVSIKTWLAEVGVEYSKILKCSIHIHHYVFCLTMD